MAELLKNTLEDEPDNLSDFLVNRTKYEYIDLKSVPIEAVWNDLYRLLIKYNVWSKEDRLTKCKKPYGFKPRVPFHDITFIMNFLYAKYEENADENIMIDDKGDLVIQKINPTESEEKNMSPIAPTPPPPLYSSVISNSNKIKTPKEQFCDSLDELELLINMKKMNREKIKIKTPKEKFCDSLDELELLINRQKMKREKIKIKTE